jgi:hypothetical protein
MQLRPQSKSRIASASLPILLALSRPVHTRSLQMQHQFGIELSSTIHIRARSGITCLTEFFVDSLRYQA